MSEVKAVRNQPTDGEGSSPSNREVSQVTLSTIGDLSMAAADLSGHAAVAGRAIRWLSIMAFLVVVYVVLCFATLFSLKRDPVVRAFLMPLFPALIATLAFWWRQQWKVRAKGANLRLNALKNTLGSISHEASCAANAIQANLAGFRLANPPLSESGHLRAIELATARIGDALQKSSAPKA